MTIPQELAFSISEFETRLARVREQMADRRVDLLMLFSPSNIYYVSGLHNDNYWDVQAVLVPLEGDPRIVISAYESGRALNSTWFGSLVRFGLDDDPIGVVAETARRLVPAPSVVGIEQRFSTLSPADFGRLSVLVGGAQVDPFGIVETPRRRKSLAELAYMQQAAQLTDAAMSAGAAAVGLGVRDTEIAAVIADSLYSGGSETSCYGPIVASGWAAGAPHSTIAGRTFSRGDSVFLELTGQVRRYTSPSMRTLVIGDPTVEMEAISKAGTNALMNMMRIARPGISANAIAAETLAILEPVLSGRLYAYLPAYSVGIGFPACWVEFLGIEIKVGNDVLMESGMTFHAIMSIRQFGEFGVNQSQTFVVTETGAEPLTHAPYGLAAV